MTFSFSTAKRLLDDQHSNLKLTTVSRHIALSPNYLGNVTAGIREQLNSLIGLYSENLQGIVIAYNNVKLQQRFGIIVDDQPNIHFDVQAEMIIFQPTVDSILKGVVNKVGRDHIGCLVHNLFNASLPKSRDPNFYVTVGQTVLFQVAKTFTQNGILSIFGHLVTESCTTEEATPRIHKKRRRSETNDNGDDDSDVTGNSSVHSKRAKHSDNFATFGAAFTENEPLSIAAFTTPTKTVHRKSMGKLANGDVSTPSTSEAAANASDGADDCLIVVTPVTPDSKAKKKKHKHSREEPDETETIVLTDEGSTPAKVKKEFGTEESAFLSSKRKKKLGLNSSLLEQDNVSTTINSTTDFSVREHLKLHKVKVEKH